MKRIALLTALPLLAWPLMASQDAGAPSKLVQVQDTGAGNLQQTAQVDYSEWADALTQTDLDKREQAFDRLIREASRDSNLADWIQETAAGQGELAWTARLALKTLPKRQFFTPTPPYSPLSADPFGMGFTDPFGDLDFFFQHPGFDIQDLMQRSQPLGGPSFQGQTSGESISIQSDPDGVKVEIRTQENGNEDVKVYEAENMDQLLEQYPELKGKVGSTQSMPTLDSLFQRRSPLLQRTQPKRVLGVYLNSSDLENGRLKVERVQPGSLADQLGVRAGDELLRMDDKPIASREDIATGLREHTSGTDITLRILGTDGEERDLKVAF
ncbi:MAG: PDZ domain-containing protein [Planctomycetes bacterium]|nr:PDZ domain-containing protein [Planctomycetota bacterium]